MLVIFDCDGVLVDSEPLAAQVFSETLLETGIHISAEECLKQFQGRTLPYCFEWLEKQFQQQLPEDFGLHLAQATQIRFDQDLRPVEGIVDVLKWLQQNDVEFCVASNGEHEKIAHSLKITGLDVFFPERFSRCCRRYSREDVAQGKPAPDLFLHAAECIGVPPSFCTVVEDSESGCKAAEAAGMRLLCYAPENKRTHSSSFSSMKNLIALL